MTDTEATEPTPTEETPQEEEITSRGASIVPMRASADALADLPNVPAGDEFRVLAQYARVMAASGIVPRSLQGKPADCLVVLMTGRDLGIPITSAMRKVYVIDGQPSIAPQLKLALIRQKGYGRIVPHPDNTATEAWAIAYDQQGNQLGPPAHYTWEDAVMAGMVRADCSPSQHSEECRKATANSNVRQTNSNGSANFCKSNWAKSPKRMVWWRAAGEAADDYFSEATLGLYCLPVRAEALTRAGWCSYEKLTLGDEILAYDPEDHQCRWIPVRHIQTYEAAQTFRLEHTRWSAIATAEHRWVVQRKGWPGRRDPGRQIRPTYALRRGEGALVLAAPAAPDQSTLTEREAAIIGWLLTDGSFRWREDRGRGGLVFASIQQSKHIAEIRSLLRPHEATERVAVKAGVQTIRGKEHECLEHHVFQLRAAFAKSLLTKAGMRTKADAIHAVTRLSMEARRAMLDAMMKANGHDAAKGPSGQLHAVFMTGHREVLDAFQALCALVGQALGRERKQGECWIVTLRRSRGVHVRDLSIAEHDVEPVWCPTTDLGTWVARLDGYVFITGNSPDELGSITDDDGNLIDVNSVDMPEGFERPGRGNSSGGGEAGPLVADEDAWRLQERVYALPDEAKAAYAERWKNMPALSGFTIRNHPAAKTALAESLLRGVEAQWKARGEFGPEAALESLRADLAGVVAGLWLVLTPPAARLEEPEPFSTVASTPPAPLEEPVAPETAETAPKPAEATTDPDPANVEEPANVPRGTKAEPEPDAVDAAIAEVKRMDLGDVKKELMDRDLSARGAEASVRLRLAMRLAEERGAPMQPTLGGAG